MLVGEVTKKELRKIKPQGYVIQAVEVIGCNEIYEIGVLLRYGGSSWKKVTEPKGAGGRNFLERKSYE